MKMRKLTAKWLEEKGACSKGLKWFKRNYPDGLVMTKKNIVGFANKLFRRKKCFNYNGVFWDSCQSLLFILEKIASYENLYNFSFYKLDWCKKYNTKEEIIEAFWKDYKNIKAKK